MPTVATPGATIYYETHGAGPALVLAHGAGGNRISWWQQVPHFARTFRLIVLDHRGFGRSTCAEGDFRPARFPDDLAAVLDAEGISRAALVCQSMGGWTGLPFALRSPERVAALVLCATPGGLWNDEVARGVRETNARIAAARIDHTPALGAAFARRRPDMRHLYDQIGALNAISLQSLARLFEPEVRIAPARLAGHRVPTLVLSGSDDLLFPPEVMRSVARDIPGAALESFDGAGHSIYFEMPERFNAAVGEFLAKHR
jgi:pimeloyl-ACP methyl ester carboxylesterase